jgi:hypothetical protein
MKWDPRDDEFLRDLEKARAGRGDRSPATQVVRFLAVALIGFAATSAALWFGPGAVAYVKGLSWPSFRVVQKLKAPRWRPWSLPEFKPAWNISKAPMLQGPSVPPLNFPRVDGIGNPNAGGGFNARGFGVRR